MCPIFKAGDVSSVVDGSVFLKEVDVALHGLRAQALPPGAGVAEGARWCLEQLSGALLADWRRRLVGVASNPPLTGVFAPVDLGAVQADPACTGEFFAGALRAWGIGADVAAAVQPGIPDAARRLELTTGSAHGLHGRLPVAGDRGDAGDHGGPAPDWSLEYVPFSLLSGEVGLLFAFTAAQHRPRA